MNDVYEVTLRIFMVNGCAATIDVVQGAVGDDPPLEWACHLHPQGPLGERVATLDEATQAVSDHLTDYHRLQFDQVERLAPRPQVGNDDDMLRSLFG